MNNFRILLLLFVIGGLLYFPIFSVGFAGDDIMQLVDYPYFHTIKTASAIFGEVIAIPSHSPNSIFGFFYRPLPFSIYTLLYTSTHGNPLYFHILQFVLYIIATYLLYLFFSSFFSQRISLGLAIIFLIHPINNELAAYIAALADTLCLTFALLSLVVINKTKKPSLISICFVCGLLLLSLFSKETGVVFVLLASIYVYYKKSIKTYILPFIATIGLYLLCRMNAAQHVLFHTLPNPAQHFFITQRLLLAPQIAFAFLREIIVPSRFALKPHVFEPTLLNSILPIFAIIFAFLICILLWILIKKRSKKNAYIFLFFSFWILAGMSLYIQLIPLEMLFAERWLYISLIGILGIIGVILKTFPLKRPLNLWITVCFFLIGIILFLYALETFKLNIMWHNWQQYFT